MHTSSLVAPQMETSLESKFSAAFEQQNSIANSMSSLAKNLLFNGSNSLRKTVPSLNSHHHHNNNNNKNSKTTTTTAAAAAAANITTTTTATPNHSESNGEKTVSFRKGNDLESFESLSSLFANGLFTDLVICCPGKMFRCHRVVMAAASLYIRDALSSFYNNNPDGSTCNNCNTVMILPTEITVHDMEAILRFIYDGHVEVKVDSIKSFLHSARMLNIKGLSNVNIVFNNNGTTTGGGDSIDDNHHHSIEVSTAKNNGYSNKTSSHNNTMLTNGHHAAASMNSPPPSPPPPSSLSSSSSSFNSSLASLKAMTTPQTPTSSSLPNGNHHLSNKLLNGSLNNHLINQYRHSLNKQRDHSPLRNESSLLGGGTNLTPAHQSSTPKSILNNGNLFAAAAAAAAAAKNNNNNSNNNVRLESSNSSVSSSSGSRRKQKFPTNIPFLSELLPPAAAALYTSWLGLNSEEDDEDDDIDDVDDEKRLIIKDDSSNDCSTMGDNMSTASLDTTNKQIMPFGGVVPSFPPQTPCMIEVEADPTTFPMFSDYNETMPQQNQQKRRRHPKSSHPHDSSVHNKKLKLPSYGSGPNPHGPNNSLDLLIKPDSPLMPINSSQSSSDLIIKQKNNNNNNSSNNNSSNTRSSSSLPGDKPLFTTYSAVKTAAGANPSATSPSSSSSASASGSWAGSKWKCDVCNKYYGNKQTLKEHMDYFHSNREEQIYICNICNKEYTWRKSLMKHYRDIHQMRNTPALAEINRQLAALATTKARIGMAMSPSNMGADDSNPLPSYVSIANFGNRKSGVSKGSSNNSEKSNKSESEIENDNTNDAMPEEESFANDDETIDMESSNVEPEDSSVLDDASSSINGETATKKSEQQQPPPVTPEKTLKSSDNSTTKNSENQTNNTSDISNVHSPASSLASS